jgi:lysophospholipase L1-like esterase
VSRRRTLIFALVPCVVLLAIGEMTARLMYYARHRDAKYLYAPLGERTPSPAPVALRHRPRQTYRAYDACSRRAIVFTVNASGGRGQPWPLARRAGVHRVLAVGESSTFGVNSPDQATWPAFLETALERREAVVEVLNGGQGGIRLDTAVENVERWLPHYRPDAVLYYGGHNDANPDSLEIGRFHTESTLGRMARALYNRSMLYTYAVERTFFVRQAWSPAARLRVDEFRRQLDTLITVARRHGATPIFVLQANRTPSIEGIETRSMDDLVAHPPSFGDGSFRHEVERVRAYRTQVLQEVVRRTADRDGVQTIDPRRALAGSPAAYFCDEVHLTDAGNQRLAQVIAERIRLPPEASR